MKFKSLKVVLIALTTTLVSFSALATSEEAKDKAERIEKDVNDVFQRALVSAVAQLNEKMEVQPFSVAKKVDGAVMLYLLGDTEKNKNLSHDERVSGVRKKLLDLAAKNEIVATAQVMYAVVVDKKTEKQSQGLTFEIEHKDGLSIVRFLPVKHILDENGKETGKLDLQTQFLSTASKPKVIFAFSQ